MRKELKVIAVVLVAVLVFVIGFGLGAKNGINIKVKYEGTPNAVAPATTTPPATETTTTLPPVSDVVSDVVSQADNVVSDVVDVVTGAAEVISDAVAGVPATPDAVVSAYIKAINDAKAYTGNVTLHKTSNVDMHVTDCSVSFATSAVDKIVQKFITGSDDTWTFSNGSDPDGRTLNDKIVPSNRNPVLSASQCAQATAESNGDGYTMTIKLNQETSTYDGTNTVNPDAHASCLDPLNLATMDVSPATITEANMTYPGATLTATVDGQGRLTKLVVNLPMSGTGTGKLGVSLTIGLEGQMDDVYEFTYA